MTPQSEIAQEAQIKEANCNAPRITPADIDKVIVGVTYTMLPSEKCMVCEITLLNGFSTYLSEFRGLVNSLKTDFKYYIFSFLLLATSNRLFLGKRFLCC